MTATRPVTTPNLYFAPPCAKPADHHDTPHKDGRLFNAAQKKRTTPRPQTTHRGQGPIATTRATCEVRAESRRVHWAWRGRDSPSPQEHGGALGSFLFFVRRMHAPHHSAWLSPRHFSPSRIFFMRAFFASCFGFVRRPAACAVGCGREAKGNDTRRGV